MAPKTADVTEKLELRNLVVLATSAREKQTAGKPLTKKEIAAVAALNARQNPAPGLEVDPLKLVRLIVQLQPKTCDDAAIRQVLGDVASDSLTEIAAAFGVTHATVKHTWRANGMPGDGKAHVFPWADVLIWFLQRNTHNDEARGKDRYADPKRDADTRRAMSEARLKELAVEMKEGEYLSVAWARSEVTAALNKIRDGIMAIGRNLMPFFPKAQAVELRDETDRQCSTVLNAVADDLLDSIDRRKEQEDVDSLS